MPSPRPRWIGAVLRIVVASTASALVIGSVAAPSASAAADPDLIKSLDRVLSDSRTARAHTGAMVLDATTGESLYSSYGTTAVMPASNTKIVTAAAAMHTLTPGFRFRTLVIRRGPVVKHTLRGRIYLKGYGDPTTRQRDYSDLAAAVQRAGITRVSGSLMVDSSWFDHERYNAGWRTSYAGDYYAAETSALTVSPNDDYDAGTVYVQYTPRSLGKSAKITTYPAAAADYIKIDNRTKTSARGSSTTFSASREHGSNTIVVRGSVPFGRSTGRQLITVDKPELYAGAVFRAELAKRKIVVDGKTKIYQTPSSKRVTIGTDTSMPLTQLLVPFLKLSNNTHAEALTKQMGRAQGRPGNWPDGLAVTTGYLQSLGVANKDVSLTDGSGVARANRLTPRALARTLQKVRSEPWYRDFYAALPVAGNAERMVGGTLRYRMSKTAAANNAHAKTGSLTGVTALSGYVTGANGRRYVLSLVSNYSGSTPRPVEDALVIALARHR